MINFSVCDNYQTDEGIKDLYIGYAKNSFPIFILIPSFSIITNLCVIITNIKKQIKKDQVSMEKMLFILSLIELFIDFYWLSSGIFFMKAGELEKKCGLCFGLSLYAVFIYSIDWIFLTFTIHNLYKIITDPIQGILRPTLRLRFYTFTSFFSAVAVTLLTYMAKVYGRSPMLTCLVRTEFFTTSQTVTLVIFFFIPLSFIFYSFYLIILMSLNKKLKSDRNISNLFYKYIVFISAYFIFNMPMVLLYILTLYYEIEEDTFLSWLSFSSCLMTASLPLGISLLRLLQGYSKIDICSLCKKKQMIKYKGSASENLLNEGGLYRTSSKAEEFEWLEKRILETFLRDIFIGICFNMRNAQIFSSRLSNSNEEPGNLKIRKKDCLFSNENIIDENNINFDDEYVKSSTSFEVMFTEYAPKVFNKLRQLESCYEEELIQSLLPMRNKSSIKQSQGKSGNFFICTDDNKFILKTISKEELELIRGIFLKKFVKHLNRFSDSLICRIYGLYKMILANGNEVLVILMRNVIGPFKPNILCKFDLKGSSINRKTPFEIDLIHNVVMKDLNFDEIEKYLILDKLGIERLRFACMTDAYFLNDMEIMDYSLFVVKLSLSMEVIEEIFGKSFHEIHLNNHTSSERSIANISVNTDEAKIANFNKKEIEHYRKYMYRSLTPNIVYIIAIIDYLQIYNFYKYLETNFKLYINNEKEISCVRPEIYCTRFIEYIKKITDISEIKKT